MYLRARTRCVCRYALRARSIKNSLRLNNKMTAEEEVVYLRGLVADQSKEIMALKEKMKKSGISV